MMIRTRQSISEYYGISPRMVSEWRRKGMPHEMVSLDGWTQMEIDTDKVDEWRNFCSKYPPHKCRKSGTGKKERVQMTFKEHVERIFHNDFVSDLRIGEEEFEKRIKNVGLDGDIPESYCGKRNFDKQILITLLKLLGEDESEFIIAEIKARIGDLPDYRVKPREEALKDLLSPITWHPSSSIEYRQRHVHQMRSYMLSTYPFLTDEERKLADEWLIKETCSGLWD